MRTRRATPRCAAELLVLLLQCCELAEPLGRAGNDPFTIVNENTGQCIKPLNDWIIAKECDQTEDMLWKWVSQHRLFHLQSQKCLGLDITKPTDSLRMFNCDSRAMLWWKCEHHSLYGAAQSRLALKGGLAIASTNSSDGWKKGGSGENLCAQPYHETYTIDGNSYGRPCEFPFLVAETWHHECILDEEHSGPWCATTLNYEYDQEWGICLNPENGCEGNWEKNEQMGSCYQFNTQAALSWKEAYVSCQNQGADLLSINSDAELTYLKEKEGIASIFWIGLNQLYASRGWEWSDHKPLNFLNWDPDTFSATVIGGSSCASMDAMSGLWQRFSCEAQLPYVCRKPLNSTVEFTDIWPYSDTRCDADWLPNNGFCYLLVNESDSWDSAHAKCKDFSSDLISIHSLADVEVVVTKLHNGDVKEETWTGLKNINTPALFQWSDGTEVTLTYWDENEPSVPYNKTPNCVSYLGKLGQWKVQSCEEKLKYVCKKKGEKMSDAQADKMCPPDEGWKRHGETCYKIYKDEVPFGTNCNLTIANRFEQEFLNDMIKKYTVSPEKYFWTGLRDVDSSGEYSWASVGGVKRSVTFSNWNFLEPASPGGCVAMATGKSLGKWEVKDCRSFRALSICKKSSAPAEPEEAAPKPEDPCPEGWQNFPPSLSCYKLFHIERIVRKRNWEEAERFCQALGGHLPSFHHVDEIKEFLHYLMDQFSGERWLWIGLNKRSPDLQGSWQWSDRTPVSTFIMENEFQQDYDVRDCAAVKVMQRLWRRGWYFHNDREYIYLRPFACDTKLEWVCQIPKGRTPKTPDWYNPERAGIHGPPVIIEGSEYWFVPEPHLNYEEAVLYCASNHSSLATLTSFAGLKAIKNKIANISSDEQKWWVRTPEQPIIDRHFIYSRHSWHHFPITFGQECLYISARTWLSDLNKPADCNTKLPFICEKYNVSSLEKYSPDSAAKIQCSGKWISFLNKCFLKLKPKSLTFSEASNTCHTYGGTLPTVLSQREQDFITSLLPDMEDALWIGLRWTAFERITKWIDNRELTYSNFHPFLVGRRLTIPTNIFEEESRYHCALMLNHRKSPLTGTWNFTSCSEYHTLSLCQKYSDTEGRQTLQNTSETVKYLNNLYKIILKTLTWPEALRECQKHSMRLVSISDPYQQAFLTVQAVLRNSSLWIGLSSEDDELNYVWSDGKHLQFSRWAENNEQLEDCVFLDTDGFWKTSECDDHQPGAICYYPGNETKKEVKPVNSVRCPSPVLNTPWIPFQNYCYNFLVAKNRYKAVTKDDVHSRCQKLNPKSHILSIRDEKENNFVLQQLLHFNYMASWVMLGLIYENNSLMWSDKTMLSYTHWRAGRPAIKNGRFFAGLSTDGFWDIHTFDAVEQIHYFHQHSILACKIEMVDYKEAYNTTLPQFIPYEDGIYSVIQKTVTWYEAINMCSQSGGHLASVHDPKGQLFLEDIAKRDGFPLWVGLSSHDGTESNFEWSDGSAFDYIPWKDKQSPGNCVLLDPKGIWKHEDCNSHRDGAICYKSTKSPEVSSLTYSSRCPAVKGNGSQWIQYRDHCYASDQALHSFSEAKQFCSELDPSATLVTIKDEDENKFVSRLMRENNNITMRVWLGLSQHPADKSWNWLDESKVKFVKWANKRKSDGGKCSVLLASNETWTKVECSHGYGRVVCKVPLGPDYRGIFIAFAVLIILALISGLIWFLFQRKRMHWAGFSSVRYEQGVNEDEIMLPSFHD